MEILDAGSPAGDQAEKPIELHSDKSISREHGCRGTWKLLGGLIHRLLRLCTICCTIYSSIHAVPYFTSIDLSDYTC